MPLIRVLIDIPERVHQGDFVLQLTKGVTEPEQTLRDYACPSKKTADLASDCTAGGLQFRHIS